MVLLNTNNLKKQSIWSIDGTLTGTTTSDQNGPGSNGNEGGIPNSPELQK